MAQTYAYSGYQREWYIYARNCNSDETCCKNWFCMNSKDSKGELEPLGWKEGLELIGKNIDVWVEYALVHSSARSRYESGQLYEHFRS